MCEVFTSILAKNQGEALNLLHEICVTRFGEIRPKLTNFFWLGIMTGLLN
jgi:hypothetical protein